MLLFRTPVPWLLLAFLGHQVSPSSGESTKNRRASKAVMLVSDRGQRSGSKPAVSGRGKFSIEQDRMECRWAAKDVADMVRITVKCENPEARVKGGITDIQCNYEAKPQLCPGYKSDPKGFWKQVARAIKKLQGKVCKDNRALLKAGMCKRAPRDAHFKLDIGSSAVSVKSGEPETPRPTAHRFTSTTISSSNSTSNSTRPCTGRVYVRERAEEYCSSQWVSMCTLFFSMLQSDECKNPIQD